MHIRDKTPHMYVSSYKKVYTFQISVLLVSHPYQMMYQPLPSYLRSNMFVTMKIIHNEVLIV